MSAITHILVLSQPGILQRQVDSLFAEERPAPVRRQFGSWFRKRA